MSSDPNNLTMGVFPDEDPLLASVKKAALGKYDILGELGRGGMACVYLERGVGFFAANLLHTLLSADTVRTIFEASCPEPVDSLASTVREFIPKDKKGDPIPFKDFDWFERKDVQNARYRASVGGAPAIDARMLLYAVLTESSGTQQALKKKLGDEAFERLRGQAEAQDSQGLTNLQI